MKTGINTVISTAALLLILSLSSSALAEYSNQIQIDAAQTLLNDPTVPPMHSPDTCAPTPVATSTPAATPTPRNTPTPVRTGTPKYAALSEPSIQESENDVMHASPNLEVLGQISWYKKHDHFEADLDTGIKLQSNLPAKVPVTIPPGFPGAGTTVIVDTTCGSPTANLGPGVTAHKGPFCTCGSANDNGVSTTDPAAYCAKKMTVMSGLASGFIPSLPSWAQGCYIIEAPTCKLTITRQCGACPNGLGPLQ